MWQLLILISVILLVYIISKVTRNSYNLIQTGHNEIVKCQVCELNVPDDQSIKKGESLYCSEECSSKNDI